MINQLLTLVNSEHYPPAELSLTGLVLINILVVSLVVLIHNSALWNLSRLIPKIPIGHFKLVIGVLGSLVAHAVEIWIFALLYHLLAINGGYGTLVSEHPLGLLDSVYFSFATYTTLGYGDIVPLGHIRYTAGIESLTGLVMITWTASFLYIEMTKFWTDHHEEKKTP